MKRGKDLAFEFSGLYLVHQNLPGKRVPKRAHPSHILFIPLQGEIKVVADKIYSLAPGHMLYLPPDLAHSFESSALDGERLIALIDPAIAHVLRGISASRLPLSQLIKELLFYLLLHPQSKNAKSLVTVFIQTLTENLHAGTANQDLCIDHLSGKIKDRRLNKFVQLLHERLNEKISVNQLAIESGLSSRSLNRLMLQELGLTPKQFLVAARIEKALELLRKPGASVTDVAYSVGYNSLSQFISAFRAQTGQLPSEVVRIGKKNENLRRKTESSSSQVLVDSFSI